MEKGKIMRTLFDELELNTENDVVKKEDKFNKSSFRFVDSLIINDACELHFDIFEKNGALFASIRKYVHSKKYTGPTKNGITVRKKVLKEIINIIEQNRFRIISSKEEVELGHVEKNSITNIVISLRESTVDNNPLCLDIREYKNSSYYKGPTKKGFRISIDQVNDFVKCCYHILEKL